VRFLIAVLRYNKRGLGVLILTSPLLIAALVMGAVELVLEKFAKGIGSVGWAFVSACEWTARKLLGPDWRRRARESTRGGLLD
jgi:hypothetical protein